MANENIGVIVMEENEIKRDKILRELISIDSNYKRDFFNTIGEIGCNIVQDYSKENIINELSRLIKFGYSLPQDVQHQYFTIIEALKLQCISNNKNIDGIMGSLNCIMFATLPYYKHLGKGFEDKIQNQNECLKELIRYIKIKDD